MNEVRYITTTKDKSFNNSIKKITDELIIKIDDIDYKSATRDNKSNLKKDEIELLAQMYDDRKSNPNSNFVLAYIKID